MKKKDPRQRKATLTRPVESPGGPSSDVTSLTLELGVHQEELKAQNEELRRAQIELSRARDRYKELFDSAPIGYLVLDGSKTIHEANLTAASLLGASRKDLIGTHLSKFMDREKADAYHLHLTAVLDRGIQQSRELTLHRPDGSVFYGLLETSPYEDSLIRKGWRIALVDITERKLGEEALHQSKQSESERAKELATILDAVPTPVFIVHDPDSTHITGNLAADELLQQARGAEASLSAPTEVRPRHFKAIKDGRELALDELPAQRAARGEHVRDFEFSLVFDDGETHHLLGYGTPLLDKQDRPRGAVHVLVDVTERKLAEEAVQRSQATLEAFFDASPGILNIEDEEFRYIKTDKLTPTYFELDHQTIVGKAVKDLAPEFMREFGDMMRQVIETGEPKLNLDVKSPVPSMPGETAYWRASYFPVPLAEGKRGIGIMGVEITDMKKAEEALRESEDRFRRVYDSNMLAITFWHADGYLTDANKAFCDLIGYTHEEVHAGNVKWIDLTPADILARDFQGMEEIKKQGVCTTYEKVFIHKDGHRVPVLIGGAMIGDAYDQGVAFIVDLTERKRLEEETRRLLATVQAERDRLSALINSMNDEVWFADTEGRFSLANPSGRHEFGIAANDGMDVEKMAASLEVYRPDGTPRPIEETPPLRALKGEVVRNQEEIIRTPATDELRYREVNSAPVRDAEGNIIGSVSVVRDITEHKRDEEELRKAKETLEERVRERTADLQNLTEQLERSRHELRKLASELVMSEERERKRIAGVLHDDIAQILASVRMRLELLRDIPSDQKDKTLQEARDLLLESIRETRALMNDLGNPLLFDLGLRAACEALAKRFMEGSTVRINCDIQEPYKYLEPDMKMILYQIVRELLNNIVKHSKAQNAHVQIYSEREHYRVKVTDDGKGFDPQTLGTPTTESGFGLYSIRERLIAVDGTLSIESAPGAGTMVMAILPAALE